MTHLLHHTRRVEFLAKPIFPKLLTSFNFKFFHLKKIYPTSNCPCFTSQIAHSIFLVPER